MMINWTGGKSPIKSDKTLVEVQYACGGVVTGSGWTLDWLWEFCSFDAKHNIVGYRILTPETEFVQ